MRPHGTSRRAAVAPVVPPEDAQGCRARVGSAPGALDSLLPQPGLREGGSTSPRVLYGVGPEGRNVLFKTLIFFLISIEIC